MITIKKKKTIGTDKDHAVPASTKFKGELSAKEIQNNNSNNNNNSK